MKDAFLIKDPVSRALRLSTPADAAVIKGMLLRGDPIQDVAAYFGCNSGRIAETKRPFLRRSRQHQPRYVDVQPAPLGTLPPPGPPMANIEITGIAKEFDQRLRGMDRKADRFQRLVEQKMEQVQTLLASFGRQVGVLEDPRTPRITSRRPMKG